MRLPACAVVAISLFVYLFFISSTVEARTDHECANLAEKIEGSCAAVLKKAKQGTLSKESVLYNQHDPLKSLRDLKSFIEDLDSKNSTQATAALKKIKGGEHPFKIIGSLGSSVNPEQALKQLTGILLAVQVQKATRSVGDRVLRDILDPRHEGETAHDFVKRALIPILERSRPTPQVNPESISCCNALSDLADSSDRGCACALKRKNYPLGSINRVTFKRKGLLKESTFEFMDGVRDKVKELSDHCGPIFDTIKATDHICNPSNRDLNLLCFTSLSFDVVRCKPRV